MITCPINASLELRQLQASDAAALSALLEVSRSALLPWIDAYELPAASDRVLDWIETGLMRYDHTGAIDAGLWHAGHLAGVVGLHNPDWPQQAADVGYWLGPAFQGQGLMTQGVRALADFVFNDYRLKRLAICCAVHNLRSRALPERLGFTLERIEPQGERINGKVYDQAIYGMTDGRWRGEPHPL